MPDEILVLILNTTRAPPLHVVGVCAFTAMHTTLTSATLAHTDTHTYTHIWTDAIYSALRAAA